MNRCARFAVLLAVAAFGCREPVPATAEAGEADAAVRKGEGPLATTKAVFTAADGRRASFVLEVADTPATREKGLMFRRQMAPDRGMVFVFPETKEQVFWMKNTYLPLDMVFIGEDFRVVGVVEDCRPLTEELRTVGVPSRYVVELNAHVAKSRGIAAGAFVAFEPPLVPVSR
jgi:uncharacterized membrane protein (UPF0127 family)